MLALAASTLAGSRLNTSLYDTPASISVMTKDFLEDVGATNVADALVYSLNAERDTSESTGNGFGSEGASRVRSAPPLLRRASDRFLQGQ